MRETAPIFVLLGVVLLGGVLAADDLLGPPCGQQNCKIHEYCDRQTYHCDQCAKICSPDHNFDQGKCMSECQVYFFDTRYYERQNDAPNAISLIDNLQLKFNVSIALIIILILGFLVLLALILHQMKRISLKKIRAVFKKNGSNKSNGISNNATNEQTAKKNDLKLDIPDGTTIQLESPTTVTTGVSRIPAEDSIVYAYDNPAMSNSPKTISSVSP